MSQKKQEHFRKRELSLHNHYVKEIRDMSGPEMILGSEEHEPLEEFTEMMIEATKNIPVNMRVLFKISEYENLKYGTVWLNYTSVAESSVPNSSIMSECFVVAKIGGQFKIVATYFLKHDNLKWLFGGGDEDLTNFYQVGKVVDVYRILSPHNHDWSIKEYNKDS